MTLRRVNDLDHTAFVGLLGGIFEDSPWVAKRACVHRPFSSIDHLFQTMRRAVEQAPGAQQLALIRAHPDLGTKARISNSSALEQAGAGLDKLTPGEYQKLMGLNEAYRARFGFPFLYAVKAGNKAMILASLEQRLKSNPEQEFAEALREIYRIAEFRIQAIFEDETQ